MISIDYNIFSNWVKTINHTGICCEEIYDQPGDLTGGTLFSMYLPTKQVGSSVLKDYSGGCSTVNNEDSNHQNDV